MSVIITGNDSLRKLRKLLVSKFKHSKVFVLTDNNTSKQCLPVFKKHIGVLPFTEIKIKSGEQNKTLATCEIIWKALLNKNADRNTLLINLGGGTICDIGGFAASVYKRGIAFVNIPTTLLAMTDAAIGGKTSVDFLHFKNMIGSFTQPHATVIHREFLTTLPPRHLNSGRAEILKHALIADQSLWNLIEKDFYVTEEVLKKSITVKTKITEKDFKEANYRKLLNFGHTIGHAIESYYLQNELDILHGEAVAAGIFIESCLSFKNNKLSLNEIVAIGDCVFKHFPPPHVPSLKYLEKFLLADKKNVSGKVNFTLLNKIGEASINNTCSKQDMLDAIAIYKLEHERYYNNAS
ncbi:MAG TPA: 3-dehydroquinate synthase [Bacteroidia bacterium]|nr:3-dehydroquinate synthase [Bacteroidia bacterium]HNU32844.1 3-dehydroquinate synthase [Bacteroidia bacterium]